MARTRAKTRQDVDGGQDLPSSSGGVAEFSIEYVFSLLYHNPTMKSKMKSEDIDKLTKYIESLKKCIKFFQQLDVNNADKLATENEARLAAERSQASLSEDLKRSEQKIQSLENLNMVLQKYNTYLQSDVDAKNEALKCAEKEKTTCLALSEQMRQLQQQLSFAQNKLQEKKDHDDYMKKLNQSIKWFQQLQVNNDAEVKNLLELEETEANDIKLQMNALQEKLAKEEANKLEMLDSLARAKEARLALERSHANAKQKYLENVRRGLLEYTTTLQYAVENVHRGLLEYTTTLQQRHDKLLSDYVATNGALNRAEKEKALLVENASQDEAVKQKDALGSEIDECTGKSRAELESLGTNTLELE